MKLEEVMVKEVIQASSDDTIAGAAQRMRERKVGCLVVTLEGAVKGIITDRDLLLCLAEEHDPYRCKVSAHMHHPVIVLRPDEELMVAAEVMSEKRIKRLPVAKNGKLLGIVSMSDLAAIAREEAAKLGSSLRFFTAVVRAQSTQSGDGATRTALTAARRPAAKQENLNGANDRLEPFDVGGPG